MPFPQLIQQCQCSQGTYTHIHTHPFNGPFSILKVNNYPPTRDDHTTLLTACILCRAGSMKLSGVHLSVCPSVSLSVPSCAAAVVCGRFAAVGPVGRQYRSIAAQRICSRTGRLSIHVHSSLAVCSKCEQCCVYSDVGS